MAGARRLQQAQRKQLLLDDPVDQLARAAPAYREGDVRGRVDTRQGAHEGPHAGSAHTM